MSIITASCPNCNAQYELTEEQLSIANGQVRCGACMTVFQAVEQAPTPPPADQTATDMIEDIHDDDSPINDDPIADQIQDTGFNDVIAEDQLSDTLVNIDGEDKYFGDEEYVGDEAEIDADEDWADQLLAEADEQEQIDAKKSAQAKATRVKEEARKLQQERAGDFDDIGFEANGKAELFDRITPEPLELRIADHTELWMNIAYGSVAAILVLIFSIQLFAFQFDKLARSENWRGFTESTCSLVGCELPERYNINEISAQHLTVKSHDLYDKSLIVDSILTNHAGFAQPFPHIQLFFTDVKQHVVAAREFSPQEYLRGELASNDIMPSRQPIHIALEIDDPGKKAGGYFIRLSYK